MLDDSRRSLWPLRILAACLIALLGSPAAVRAKDGAETPPRWVRLDNRALARELASRALPEQSKVERVIAAIQSRSRVWRAAKNGQLHGFRKGWLDYGEFRFLLQFAVYRSPPNSDPRPIELLRAVIGSREESDPWVLAVLRTALAMAGSEDPADVEACAGIVRGGEQAAPLDLRALALEQLSGRCPPSLLAALMAALRSKAHFSEMGTGAIRFPLRDAAAGRLAEFGLVVQQAVVKEPNPGGTVQESVVPVIETASLVRLLRAQIRSGTAKEVSAVLDVLRAERRPELEKLRAELQRDVSLPANVREMLAAIR